MLMIDKKGIYELFKRNKITYEIYEHDPAYTIEELDDLKIPNSDRIAKNLFLNDDKKQNYYLVTVPGKKTVNLKELSKQIPSRRLSLASEDSLKNLLMLERGHVTPLGIFNNTQKNVIVVFDQCLLNQKIGIHPMENTATIFVAFSDIKRLIEEHGNPVIMCDIK